MRFHPVSLHDQYGKATLSVVLVYGVFAALWILFSDQAVEAFIADPAMIIRASMMKGWLFVAVTTGLLYVLVKRQVSLLNAAHRKELASYQERQKSLDLLNAIVDNSDDAIFAKDSQGRYLLFNNAASRFVGKPVAEVLGQDDRALFSAEQAEKLMAIGRRILADGHTETHEETLDTALGRRVFLATKGPLRDADKRIFGLFGISRDVTASKQAEAVVAEREEMFRTLTSNIPGAVYRCELNFPWRVSMMSDGVLPLTGHAAAEFIRPDHPVQWGNLVIPDDLPKIAEDIEAATRQKSPYSLIYRIRHADGNICWVLEHGRTIYDATGAPSHLDGVIFDITVRKAQEEELKQRNDELERFNRATIGRELDIIEMKKRINDLSRELGRQPPYPLAFEQEEKA
jgi:PAS domain S-box-containing protein